MDKIKLSDVPPFDGTYDFDPARPFTGNELHLIKDVAKVRLGEIMEALNAGDYDVVVAFAAIALWRAGKVTKDTVRPVVEMLMEAEVGKIDYIDGDKDVALPPQEAPSELVSSGASNGSSPPSSKDLSPIGDDLPETIPSATGLRGLETTAISDLAI